MVSGWWSGGMVGGWLGAMVGWLGGGVISMKGWVLVDVTRLQKD